jgi:hypothetical protein
MPHKTIRWRSGSDEERRSLVALQAALGARGAVRYMEVGCYLGATLQSFVTDPNCEAITAIDRRDAVSRDERGRIRYPENTTAHMLERLAEVPGADLGKLLTIDASTDDLDPNAYTADLCFIDAEHTDDAVVRDARFCRRVIRDRGVIAFQERTVVRRGIRRFLRGLPSRGYRVYPLRHELLVVEIGIPSLLSDPAVRGRLPRSVWLAAGRLRLEPVLLWVTSLRLRANVAVNTAARSLRALRRLPARFHARLPARRPPLYLAVCAIFRDEAQYLAEWVAFHRLQGVQRFWLYDNLSRDDWRSALEPYSDIVDVIPWPEEPGQYSAYLDCLKRHRSDARWIAFLDLDEFLFSPTEQSLVDALPEFERHPAVVVNWRLYGTNGHEQPPEGLVIENYLMRGADEHPDNCYVKSIVDPRRTDLIVNDPHVFHHFGTAVGEDHRPTHGAWRDPPSTELFRINHYYSRSISEFERKRALPRASGGDVRETSELPRDVLRDEAILRFVTALREALAARAVGDSART